MKRYQITNFYFDSRPAFLTKTIDENWSDAMKEEERKNQENIIEGFLFQFGFADQEMKIRNLSDLNSMPPTIISFHLNFWDQIRNSFTIGAYYPALTGACCLGERILNHLFLLLRSQFFLDSKYNKYIRKNGTLTNWEKLIEILSNWKILLPQVIDDYHKLKYLRHKSIHFNYGTYENDRGDALSAINFLKNIVFLQFGIFGPQPWFIKGTRGAFFIKKAYENDPFIKAVYLPNCVLFNVGDDLEGTDEEFVKLLESQS